MIFGQLKAEKERAKIKENSFNHAQWKLPALFKSKQKETESKECITELCYQNRPEGYQNTVICHSPLMDYYKKGIVVSREYEASIEYQHSTEKHSESIPLEKVVKKIKHLIEGIEKRRQSHKEFTGQELEMPKIVILPEQVFGCLIYSDFIEGPAAAGVIGNTIFVNAGKILGVNSKRIKNVGNHETGHLRDLPMSATTSESYIYELLNEWWARKDIQTNYGGYQSDFIHFAKFLNETKKRLNADPKEFDNLTKGWYIEGPGKVAYYLDKAWGTYTTANLIKCKDSYELRKFLESLRIA
jgi:hypothetical protein